MKYAHGTELRTRQPWGINTYCRAVCPDGKVRTMSRIAIVADTFWTIPAKVNVRGVSVKGYVDFVDCNNPTCSTTQDNTVLAVRFIAIDSPNADKVFPKQPFVALDDFEFAANYGDKATSKLVRF